MLRQQERVSPARGLPPSPSPRWIRPTCGSSCSRRQQGQRTRFPKSTSSYAVSRGPLRLASVAHPSSGEPRRGKKTLLDRFIANSDSSLAAFPYPPASQQKPVSQPRPSSRNVRSNAASASTGPCFLTRNHAAYAANGGSSLGLSSVAEGTTNIQAGKVPAPSVNNSTRRRDPKGKEAEHEENGNASASGQSLRLDVLEDPRLKRTEGLILGYEWVDISQPGEASQSSRSTSPINHH